MFGPCGAILRRERKPVMITSLLSPNRPEDNGIVRNYSWLISTRARLVGIGSHREETLLRQMLLSFNRRAESKHFPQAISAFLQPDTSAKPKSPFQSSNWMTR